MKKSLAILLVFCLMFTSLFSIPVFAEEVTTFLMTELEGKYKSQGRNYLNADGVLLVNYPANGVEFNAYCKGDVYVTFNVTNLGYKEGIGGCYFTVIVDGVTLDRETCHITQTGEVTVKIAEGLAEGNHTFKLFRQNEITYASLGLKSITLDGEVLDAPANKDMYIEVVGDSVTGGWGNLGNSSTPDEDNAAVQDATQAYPYYTAQNLDADFSSISVGGIGAYWGGNTMNTVYQYYGYFNDKKTLYDFENTRKPNYVVIGLGTNDYSKASQNGKTEDDLLEAYKYFARLIRMKNPDARIVWAHGVMNYKASPYIEEAVESLGGAEYGIYEVRVTANTEGVSAHATAEGGKVIADEISDCIKAIEAENKPFKSEFPPMVYEEVNGEIILESDFGSTTNWTARGGATLVDEDNDGVKEVVRLTSSKDSHRALRSAPFTLIPGNEYELTYYVRVPEDSGEFGTSYYPTTAIYQPTLNAEGTKVTDNFVDGTDGNGYAYKNVRRHDFVSTWQIGEYYPITRKNYSSLGSAHSVACAYDSPNKVYDGWTRVTAKFTALDDANNVGNQTAALYFGFNTKVDGLIYEFKDVTLKNTSAVVEEPTTQKTILTSDFDNSDGTNWQMSTGAVTYSDDNGDGVNDYASVKISSTNKGVGLFSTPFNLIPDNKYELTYYIRVPKDSVSFNIGSTFYAPTTALYQPKVNDAGTKVSSTPSVANTETANNYYAYNQKYKAPTETEPEVLAWSRRAGFKATWTIDGYEPTVKSNFSSFGYNDHGSVLSATNADLNAAFANWTKVTVNFTAMAAVEGETSQVTALGFTFDSYKSSDNFVFDIKDVKLVENPDGAEEPEQPENPEEPENPENPAEPIETPYISAVGPDGNQYFYGADIGAKVDVKANEDGSNTFTLTYDDMDGVNLFKGWYNGDTFLSADKTFTAPANVNKDDVKAKILCRSVISGGLGFESYTEKTTPLHVHPEDASQNLHNVAPFDDKWGQMYKTYQPANEFLMTIDAINGNKSVKFKSDYVDGVFKTSSVTVTPYSGNSMLIIAMAPSRAIVRKLDNLKPNTNYELSFYVYNASDYAFLNTAIITDDYNLPAGSVSSSKYKVYNYYKAETTTNNKHEQSSTTPNNGFKAVKDLAQTWHKVSVTFTTDADDTELYLQFATECGDTKQATSPVFVDNLTCCEMGVGYTGNAIRGEDSALRYKFYVDNDMLTGYAGMKAKKIGVLAAKSDLCGDESLEIGKSFAKDVEVTENNFVTDSQNPSNKYFTVALYNIGKKGNKTDFSTYGSDFAVRPYIIYEDANGEETILYGDTIDASIFKVMLAIFGDNRNEDDITIANNILAKEEVKTAYFDWQPTDGWYFGESQAKDYAFSFAVVGDTQKTTGYYSDKLHYIYDWIIDNKDSKNIQYVLGLGDITESKYEDKEWPIATEQLDRLEAAGINQSIVRGNHDDEPYYDQFITMDKYGKNLTGSYDDTMRNTYRLITINGIKYMILTLDFQPTAGALAWAEEKIKENSDYNVILTTHSYFDHDMVYDPDPQNSELTSGVELFNNLVNKYSNIVLVLCGHRYPPDNGPNYIITEREDGSKVMQMMVNPQKHEADEKQSLGMLAMLYFSPDGKNVQLEYFSTINGMFYKDKFQFNFELDLVD